MDEAGWTVLYEELKAYKAEKGDCNVPPKWPDNKKLGAWLESQRAYYARRMKDGRDPSAHITKPRIAKLEELELDWDPKETVWCEMFEALVVYKKENGDCNVPKGYEPNKKLGTWTARQRKDYVKIVKARDGGKAEPEPETIKLSSFVGTQAMDHLSKLEKLGFE